MGLRVGSGPEIWSRVQLCADRLWELLPILAYNFFAVVHTDELIRL